MALGDLNPSSATSGCWSLNNLVRKHTSRPEKADVSVPYQEDSLAFLSRNNNDGILTLLQRISRERLLRDSILLVFAITIVAAMALWLIARASTTGTSTAAAEPTPSSRAG